MTGGTSNYFDRWSVDGKNSLYSSSIRTSLSLQKRSYARAAAVQLNVPFDAAPKHVNKVYHMSDTGVREVVVQFLEPFGREIDSQGRSLSLSLPQRSCHKEKFDVK